MGERPGGMPREAPGDGHDRQRLVVKAHRASHADPIAVRASDLVAIGRRDSTWPDYLWCTGPDRREGWVPEAFLEPPGEEAGASGGMVTDNAAVDANLHRARRDYDARELNVASGDVVLAGEEAGGWLWCEATDGRSGWVPAECLAAVEAKGEP